MTFRRPTSRFQGMAGNLDRWYVQARYPDGFPRGKPGDYVDQEEVRMRSAVREESYSSVRVFWLDSEFITGQLRQRAEELVRNGRAKKVVLFGSLATGRAVPGSDADILIVVEDDGRPLEDRMDEYLEFFSGYRYRCRCLPLYPR